MKKYLVRALKYFLFLCVVYLAAMALMFYTQTLGMPYTDQFWETLQLQLFSTQKGRLMIPALVLLAALYPRFGFMRRRVEASIETHFEQIETAFRLHGFRLVERRDKELTFRADTLWRRITMLFEDEIKLYEREGEIELVGIRRGLARVIFTLVGYLENLRIKGN